MSLNVGELSAFLTLDDSQFQQGMTGSGSAMDGLLSIGRKAAVGVGLAMAAGAAYSLSAFTDFDTGMREVFTLLPGISDQAMADMTQQVKDFSLEFGVLPDEVVPSLYQALSAGVPPDNVFDFLETAQMAARGGVTDLATAVDGISSVVNAYGDEIIDATQASDLMFTAVRLGKTNFEELSASLFQVTPTAAGLGVEFGTVTAALATLTAQGVPTSVASTQIRQALVELGDSGSQVGQTFQDLSGQSFRDFIASGGTLQDALGMLAQHATDTGVGVGELFGSVEAGQAVLGLTGANADAFGDALEEMGASAGATEAAYDGMAGGMQFQLDRLKAAASVFAIEVGGRLASVAAPALELAADVMAAFGEGGIQGAIDQLRSAFEGMPGWLQVVIGAAGLGGLAAIAVVVAGALSFLVSIPVAVAAAIGALAAAVVWAYNNFEGFRNVIDAVVAWMVGTAWPAIQQFAAYISDQFSNLVAWVRDHWDAIQEAIDHVLNVVGAIIGAYLTYIQTMWQAWGDDLLGMVTAAWDFVTRTIENAVSMIASIIELVLSVINGDWGDAWQALQDIASTAWDQLLNVLRLGWELLKGIFGAALSTLRTLFSIGWEAIKAVVPAAWRFMQQATSTALIAIVSFIASLPQRALSVLSSLPGLLAGLGRAAMGALRDGLSAVWGSVRGWLAGLPGQIVSAIGSLGRLLYNTGRDAIQGLLDGMRAVADRVRSFVRDLAGDIVSAISNPLEILSPSRVMADVGRNVIEGLIVGMDDRAPALNDLADGIAAGLAANLTPRLSVGDLDSFGEFASVGPAVDRGRLVTGGGAGGGAAEGFDYDRLGQAIASALVGQPLAEARIPVELDGRHVAEVLVPIVRDDVRSRR